MFLKQLQIKGFKSFADTTTLVMEPGVTVVVGPNGSGKSNVVDAIGWVLGAQRPSAVRSQKMDDVIFAGSAKRAALGRAEVTLTIDNSAGLLPIEFNEVTISRVLFRNGDSEYAINGVGCRLLDVTDLLSDAGVGRQQHVIISQGQIDAVLNSKPEERRSIIEEAAGVLKYRKRKERSERRLVSTEANLTRLADLVREVKRQLKPLERQAEAARRHGDLADELRACRLFVVGSGLRRLSGQLEQSIDLARSRAQTDAELRSELADLDARVVAAEAEMSALGESDHTELATRYETLLARARGTAALLSERRKNLDRERSAFIDQGAIHAAEAEHAQLGTELAEVERDGEALLALDAEHRQAQAAAHELRVAFEERWGSGVESPAAELSEVRTELAALRTAAERSGADRTRVETRLTQLGDRASGAVERLAELVAARDGSQASLGALSASVEAAETRLRACEAAESEADEQARSTGDDLTRWSARADALAQALDAARQRAGVSLLSGADGVLGTLLDLVAVDAGWESAFEAAAAEALNAIVVDSRRSAEDAIERLLAEGGSAAVLALGAAGDAGSATPGDDSVRAHVRSSDARVERLLDRLLSNVVRCDGPWTDALDRSIDTPDAVVVTGRGERFSARGYFVGHTATAATGDALSEATAARDAAAVSHADARTRHIEAREALKAAKSSHRSALDELETAERNARRSAEAAERLEAEAETVGTERQQLEEHLAEIVARAQREVERRDVLAARLVDLETAEALRDSRAAQMRSEQHLLDERTAAASALRSDLEVRAAATEERRRFLTERRRAVAERLERNRREADEAAVRRVELSARASATERLARFVETRIDIISADAALVRERRRAQSEAARTVVARLDALRTRRSEAEKRLEALVAQAHAAEVADTETRLRIEGLTEQCRSELSVEADQAMAAPRPDLPEGVSPAERIRQLERELRLMGPINPLAVEEHAELAERHEFLSTQLEDVRSSRRELQRVIRAVDAEIVNVFAAAYADVEANFEFLLTNLFPGGRGGLVLTDPSDLLNTGIEIEAKPSGKNVKKLSLLSGGERSLVALAFLFAVFRSRPSPFYVMDEVEAALDDVNLHRFLSLISEFRDTAQLIIVSHQKRTMEAADVLYGVTMEPGGSSKVISERVKV